MNKIEHIGIAVKDIEQSNTLFSIILGTKPYNQEKVASEHVITSFFEVGETKIELLQATSEDSAISKFIAKNGEGIHHIAFDVDNVQDKLNELKEAGLDLIHAQPKEGADNKLIAFLHPKSTNRVLTELCQEKA